MFSTFLTVALLGQVLASPQQAPAKTLPAPEKVLPATTAEKNGDWPIQRPEFKQGPVKRVYLNNMQCWAEAAEVLEGDHKGHYVPYRTYAKQQQIATSGDGYGFLAWLNGVRAQNGRRAVGFDANLSSWAQVNNGQQHARGMGHHVMGNARRQNAGMGQAATVWQMWMASPAHQAALLDPTITQIGIAASGAYWTFNAY